MAYRKTPLLSSITVDSIITVHYFEYMNNFTYPGERHDFWEFLCVDKGEVEVFNGSFWQTLKRGQVIFHKPMEFHSLRANGITAPNLVVVSFDSSSEAMKFFEHRILNFNKFERDLLSSIIHEAGNTFEGPLDDPMQTHLELCRSTDFASLQLIKLYLEHFLIDVVRQETSSNESLPSKITTFYRERTDNDIADRIIKYFEENVRNPLTVEQICKANLVSYSSLKVIFHNRYSCGVLEYFNKMRISMAKQLIRNQQMNMSEIADYLGYNSVHYFSRQFKKLTGMTPTEYSSSIIIRSSCKPGYAY